LAITLIWKTQADRRYMSLSWLSNLALSVLLIMSLSSRMPVSSVKKPFRCPK